MPRPIRRPIPSPRPMIDHRAVVETRTAAAVERAFLLMMRRGAAGLSSEFQAIVAPSPDGESVRIEFKADDEPTPEGWAIVRGVTIDGSQTKQQMLNRCRGAFDRVPLFAKSFRDSHGFPTPDARTTLDLQPVTKG